MNTASHNKLVSFIWSIADDCLRDVHVRGKYRGVILPIYEIEEVEWAAGKDNEYAHVYTDGYF